jgi:hypothetical protein
VNGVMKTMMKMKMRNKYRDNEKAFIKERKTCKRRIRPLCESKRTA